MRSKFIGGLLGACALAVASPTWADTAADIAQLRSQMAQVQADLAAAKAKITAQEDTEAIRVLAHTYAYYMDNALYDEALSLMSDKIESCEIGGYGVYLGKAGCTRLWKGVVGGYYGGAENQMRFGELHKHYLVKDVITVAPEGHTAKGRFDYFTFSGQFKKPERTGHQIGTYNLDFVKEDGVWKIGKFWLTFATSLYNQGDWANNPGYRCDNKKYPADKPTTWYHPFPEAAVVPFHYPNPVTGKEIPATVLQERYWIGNWPGEYGKECGHR